MTKLRLFSVLALVAAAAVFALAQANGLDRLARQCLSTTASDGAMDTCMEAYEAEQLTDTERGLVAFRLGRLHKANRNWDQAVRFYGETIRLYPQKTRAFYDRAWLRHQYLDDNAGAIADYSDYIAAGGREISGLTMRAHVYRETDAFALAEADLQAAAAIDPDDRWLLREQADLLQDTNDDAAALAVLDRAIALHPSVMSLWRERSWVKRQLNDNGGALADIGHVIGTDPGAMWPWYQRGWLNVRRQNYSQALTDLQTAIEKDPTYRPAQREMKRLMESIQGWLRGQPAQLTAFADAGLINAPSDKDLLYLRAIGQMGEGKFIGAINDINLVIDATEHPQALIFARSAIHLTAQQFDLALADLEWLTRDPGAYDDAINEIAAQAQALMEDGKHDEAAILDGDVGVLASLYATALQARVAVNIGRNNWLGALEAIDLMIAYDGDDSSHWTARGEALERLGRPDEALESYSAAIRLIEAGATDLSSDNDARANAHLLRGALFQSLRRGQEATTDFETALSIGGAPLIRGFQQKMQDAGHYSGAIDGTYDMTTRDAVRRCANDPTC
ncbi:tetratricopeptide repeat protein [Yoonia sp. F2084L]|uniref:tetratricopeptide repeat protein n=1 Tax=Yoonia sp. F2084L TaxID=2926419 RepID=UPI001FF34DD1|nr:tetratricopeptide repeat protein [Yoonia sp. F2084L]MCK0096593.1 tetratricopeptide repeat protein [Yoonia sp. F2084L]